MSQLLVLVRVGGPQLKYDYFGGRSQKRFALLTVSFIYLKTHFSF